jgi:hypothetical protein
MCTPQIISATVASTAATVSRRGKPLIGQDIIPRAKVPEVKPPPELSPEELRKRRRELSRGVRGVPGPGRAGTIFTGSTIGGAPAIASLLKSRTGQ